MVQLEKANQGDDDFFTALAESKIMVENIDASCYAKNVDAAIETLRTLQDTRQ
jgi:hypothetical protein